MRLTILFALAALASACARETLTDAPVIVPRPAPLAPEPPLGSIGPVLGPVPEAVPVR